MTNLINSYELRSAEFHRTPSAARSEYFTLPTDSANSLKSDGFASRFPRNLLPPSSPELCYTMFMSLVNDKPWIERNPVYFYPESKKTAVIIDPRYDVLMEAVIRNFMYFMNPEGWNLRIVSYSGYKDQILRDFPNCQFDAIDENQIRIDEKGIPNITIDYYNSLCTSLSFWEKMTEKVVIFQKDCIMFRMFPSYFINYDFAGANFYGAVSPRYGGLNGGFSLRTRSAMIDCIRHVSAIRMYAYNPAIVSDKDKLNEDVFFTHACEILHKLVPDPIHRAFFAIENDYNEQTAVFHGWDKYTKHPDFMAKMLIQSPLFSRYIRADVPRTP
jgi:hypothetical protein